MDAVSSEGSGRFSNQRTVLHYITPLGFVPCFRHQDSHGQSIPIGLSFLVSPPRPVDSVWSRNGNRFCKRIYRIHYIVIYQLRVLFCGAQSFRFSTGLGSGRNRSKKL